MPILREFREFAVKGSVVDLAVGVVVGAAFGAIVKSLVDDLIMPLVGLLVGGIDFSSRYWVLRGPKSPLPEGVTDPTMQQMRDAGAVVVAYGQFANAILTFLIVALAVFLFVKGINRLRRRQEPAAPNERPCPECLSAIPKAARRCRACTAVVTPTA
jgi:large conductance mechanosensitive channel